MFNTWNRPRFRVRNRKRNRIRRLPEPLFVLERLLEPWYTRRNFGNLILLLRGFGPRPFSSSFYSFTPFFRRFSIRQSIIFAIISEWENGKHPSIDRVVCFTHNVRKGLILRQNFVFRNSSNFEEGRELLWAVSDSESISQVQPLNNSSVSYRMLPF